jgi:hypothetical protein
MGSNDGGATWTVLDEQHGEVFAGRFEKHTYSVANTTAYNVYRLNILSVINPGGANSVQLSEIELIGLPPLPPPTIVSAVYDPGAGARVLTYRFSQDVGASLGVGDIQVKNVSTNQTVTPGGVSYDPQTNTATFTFASLPDGNYTATLVAAGITDSSGNPLDGNGDGNGGDSYAHSFFVLAGDINRDRKVDFNDLVVLAQNYNSTGGKTWAQGDLSGDGNVDFNDLVILAQRYNVSLAAPAAPVAAPAAAASPVTASAKAVQSSGKKDSKPIFSTVAVSKPAAPKPKPARPQVARASRP